MIVFAVGVNRANVPLESEEVRTATVYRRDIAEVLSFDGRVVAVDVEVPGTKVMVVQVAVEPLDLYDIGPAIASASIVTKVSFIGRKGAFPCADLSIIERLESADPGTSSGVDGGASQALLRCEIPAEVTAYDGVETSMRLTFPTERGRQRVLTLSGVVSSEVGPAANVRDHYEVRSPVDPPLLYSLGPALEAATARGTAGVVGRDGLIDCVEVTLVDTALAVPKGNVSGEDGLAPLAEVQVEVGCVLAPEVEVYDGLDASLVVTTHEVTDVVAVPMSAVRFVDSNSGVVALVSGRDEHGRPVVNNRAVGLGTTDGLAVEVVTGLDEGDEVLDPIVR